ncbi:hypothetical protein D9M69_609180 [compost metagenome]
MGDGRVLSLVQLGEEGVLHRQRDAAGGLAVGRGDMATGGPGGGNPRMLDDVGDYRVVTVDTLQGAHGAYLVVEGPGPRKSAGPAGVAGKFNERSARALLTSGYSTASLPSQCNRPRVVRRPAGFRLNWLFGANRCRADVARFPAAPWPEWAASCGPFCSWAGQTFGLLGD